MLLKTKTIGEKSGRKLSKEVLTSACFCFVNVMVGC